MIKYENGLRMDEHAQKAAGRFDKWAETYGDDRISGWFRYYQTFAISKLDIENGHGFLDVGCGPGCAVREVAMKLSKGKACGIDISPKMIEKAMTLAQGLKNVEFRLANAESIPFPNESFSSILCSFSFHHYQKPVKALSEMKRVMRKHGKLVILDSSRNASIVMWLQDRWRRYFERSHVRYYSTSELRTLVGKAQLEPLGDIVTIRKFMFHKKVFTGLMLIVCTK